MKIRSLQGNVVTIGDERAEKLIASGHYTPAGEDWHAAPESVPETGHDEQEGDDTPELVQEPEEPSEAQEDTVVAAPRPTAAVVRAWAKDNDVEVPATGRVPDSVYEQYDEAHKN